jgi:hypothetical protein
MKVDDAEFEKRLQEMFERRKKMSALTIEILSSHLLAEQCMNDYLIACGKKPKWVHRQKFSKKMQQCKRLAKDEADGGLWGVLDAANQLRNTIAHSLSADKITEKMQQLKDRYLACLTARQAAGLADQPEDYIAQSACLNCAGFIAALTDAKGAKEASSGGRP